MNPLPILPSRPALGYLAGLSQSKSVSTAVTAEELAVLKALVERLERDLQPKGGRPATPPAPVPRQPQTGPSYQLLGTETSFLAKKDLYLSFLERLALLATDKEFDVLASRVRAPRGKRPYLARSANALFPGNPDLVDLRCYAYLATPAGRWYVDTNLNGATMRDVLHRACRSLGLARGADYEVWGL